MQFRSSRKIQVLFQDVYAAQVTKVKYMWLQIAIRPAMRVFIVINDNGSSRQLSCVISISATLHRCGDAVLPVRAKAVPLSKDLMIPKHSQLLRAPQRFPRIRSIKP